METTQKFKLFALLLVLVPMAVHYVWLEVTGHGKYEQIISEIIKSPNREIYPIKIEVNNKKYIVEYSDSLAIRTLNFKQSILDIQSSEWGHASDDSISIDISLNLSNIFIHGFIEPENPGIFYAYVGIDSRIYGKFESEKVVIWLRSNGFWGHK